MSQNSYPVFEELVRTYLNVDAILVDNLRRYLQNNRHLDEAQCFRNELANAILHDSISPKEYERITFEDFDSQDDLRAWLIELWRDLYGDVPVIAAE